MVSNLIATRSSSTVDFFYQTRGISELHELRFNFASTSAIRLSSYHDNAMNATNLSNIPQSPTFVVDSCLVSDCIERLLQVATVYYSILEHNRGI